jgi:hypothetical protein
MFVGWNDEIAHTYLPQAIEYYCNGDDAKAFNNLDNAWMDIE